MSDEEEFILAKADADKARAALTGTLVDIQARINPRALARDAFEELRDAGLEMVRRVVGAAKRNPAPLIGIGATIIGILAKDWIMDAVIQREKDATDADLPRSHTEADTHVAKGPSND